MDEDLILQEKMMARRRANAAKGGRRTAELGKSGFKTMTKRQRSEAGKKGHAAMVRKLMSEEMVKEVEDVN